MTAREEAARRFAEAMGICHGCLVNTRHIVGPGEKSHDLRLPAPDATLHEHLAFVGRVAEAVGCYFPAIRMSDQIAEGFFVSVHETDDEIGADASDLSWAALLAGCAAKESKHV